MLRELAWIELDMEPVDGDERQTSLMSDDEFEQEVALAADGRWSELGLDDLPDGWQEATIEDLRDV